jgi:predicted negative regulator of RcsB-dependent stress response
VTELRTEEEQLDAIKSWWKDNGKSLVIMIAVAVSAVYGYKAWQNKQVTTSENASHMYQQLIDSAIDSPQAEAEVKEKNFATTKHLAKSLQEQHTQTQYAKYAALVLAKVAVNTGDLNLASQQLDWVLSQEPEPLIKSIALIRKAQILSEQSQFDQALGLLKDVTIASIQVQAAELEGDIYLAKGDSQKARKAYRKAMDNKAVGNARDLLSLKLNDLAVDSSTSTDTEEG